MEILLVIIFVLFLFVIIQIIRIRISGPEVKESAPDIDILKHKTEISDKPAELQQNVH